jgi:hypothetical protein
MNTSLQIVATVGTWVIALVGIGNLILQGYALRRTARLQAAATYAATVYDIVSAGGSGHDVTTSRNAQRELLRALRREMKAVGVDPKVPEDWPTNL